MCLRFLKKSVLKFLDPHCVISFPSSQRGVSTEDARERHTALRISIGEGLTGCASCVRGQ